MNEEVIRIEDIVNALKKRWKMIAGVTVGCTLLAGIFTFAVIKPKYEAKVKVFIGKEAAMSSSDLNYDNNDVMMYQKLMKTYAEVIKTSDATEAALKEVGQEVSQQNINRVLGGLTVSPSADTQIMEVKYTTTDKSELLPVLNSVTDEFIDNSEDLIPNGNVQIIQKAKEPLGPISPNKPMNVIIGFMLGLMVSVGIVFLLEYLDNTVKNKEELEEFLGIPVLGSVPIIENNDD